MTSFQKWMLGVSSALTGLTGAVYWWMKHVLEPSEPWAVINHPLQPLVLKLHIVVAPILVFAVGLITVDHIWKQFRHSIKLGRRSGLLTMFVVGPMILTGYLIQAVTAPVALRVIVWLHLGTSVAYLAGLLVHHWVFRRRRAIRARLGGGRWVAVGRPASSAGSSSARPPGAPRGERTPVSP